MQDDDFSMSNQSLTKEAKKKIAEELIKSTERYHKMMKILESDAPIEVLCLDKKTEDLLRMHEIFRVYDVLELDLAKVEFLDARSIGQVSSRLNEFVSMF